MVGAETGEFNRKYLFCEPATKINIIYDIYFCGGLPCIVLYWLIDHRSPNTFFLCVLLQLLGVSIIMNCDMLLYYYEFLFKIKLFNNILQKGFQHKVANVTSVNLWLWHCIGYEYFTGGIKGVVYKVHKPKKKKVFCKILDCWTNTGLDHLRLIMSLGSFPNTTWLCGCYIMDYLILNLALTFPLYCCCNKWVPV